MVSVFVRPNPAVDWRPFNDPVYDPIWQAASDTGLPIALHPFLAPDLPGASEAGDTDLEGIVGDTRFQLAMLR